MTMSYQQSPGYPQPSHPAQPPPAPRKSRRWPWIVVGALAVIVMLGVVANLTDTGTSTEPGGVAAGNEKGAPAEEGTPAERVVVYKVTGTGPASVTYTTDGATTINQESDVALPWEKTIKLPADESLLLVSLLAQGMSEASKVDVEIVVDGKKFKEAHVNGYGVASANGNIGDL